MRQVTVDTVLAPTIGYPMRQSLSAKLSNVMYERMGIDYLRFPIELEHAEDLGKVIAGLRCMNVKSIGITAPYKVEAMKYCDELDPFAEKIGAVNHLHFIDGKIVGFCRDGEGFLYSMDHLGVPVEGGTFFCLGAGGTGRSISGALANRGAGKVYITDIYEESARMLTDRINEKIAPVAEFIDYNDTALVERLAHECDVVMNVTGLGMAPHLDKTPLNAAAFRAGQVAFDACYNPPETRFLKEAKAAGCRIISAKSMLVRLQMMGAERRCGYKVDNYDEWAAEFDRLLAEQQAEQNK